MSQTFAFIIYVNEGTYMYVTLADIKYFGNEYEISKANRKEFQIWWLCITSYTAMQGLGI